MPKSPRHLEPNISLNKRARILQARGQELIRFGAVMRFEIVFTNLMLFRQRRKTQQVCEENKGFHSIVF